MNSTTPEDGAQLLAQATQALSEGRFNEARRQGRAVLRRARSTSNRELEGMALTTLSLTERASNRFGRAQNLAQRAAPLMRIFGDIRKEITALTVLAHASTLLARDEEAVDAAFLALSLAEELGEPRLVATCQNYVGISCLWNHDFERADQALLTAIALVAEESDDASAALQPKMNYALSACIRFNAERYRFGTRPDPTELLRRVEAFLPALEGPLPAVMLPADRQSLHDLACATAALARVWSGDVDSDRLASRSPTAAQPRGIVAHLFWHWAATEHAWACQSWEQAHEQVTALIARASDTNFEQMAMVGQLLRRQIYVEQGRLDAALAEEAALREREHRIRLARIAARQRTVRNNLEIRELEHRMAQVTRRSQEFERLSSEDALTGLVNRRRFDVELQAHMKAFRDTGAPFSVALLDIDRFKSVNDTFTHLGGDAALRAVASLLRASVRASDLPARLAGDEFVIIFPQTELAAATRRCDRLRQSVADLDIAFDGRPIHLSVSIGVAQVRSEDELEDLIHRADVEMYRCKTTRTQDNLSCDDVR